MEDPTAEPAERCEAAEICATAAFFSDDFDRLRDYISPWRESLQDQPPHQQIVGIGMHDSRQRLHGAWRHNHAVGAE